MRNWTSLLILIFSSVVSCLIVTAGEKPSPSDGRLTRAGALDYDSTVMEFFFNAKKAEYVRPGLNIAVDSIEINDELKPVITLRYYDDRGRALDRNGLMTPGSISTRFILAWYDGATRQYTAYTTRTATSSITGDSALQATSDSGGAWLDVEIGHAVYTFGTVLPADFDGSRTHSLAIYSTRNTEDIIGKDYEFNLVEDFRPDGGEITEVWNAMTNDTCNTCHDPLAIHGGHRRDVKLCVTCHNEGTTDPDTGNTMDMRVLIHKIHMGEHLPSVQAGTPYQVIGFRNSVHDYSHVAYPQDLRNCVSCHPSDSPEGHIWYTNPSRAACGSCHDNINWETGEGHTPGPATDDSACANCHIPEGERDFDISVVGSHVVPTKSSMLAGLNAEILDVSDTAPGEHPTVSFRVTNDDGSVVDPSDLDRLNIRIAGPNSEYAEQFAEGAADAIFDGDVATYTFANPIPSHATGTWTASADIYRNVALPAGREETITVREAAFNPIKHFPVTDLSVSQRRQIVDLNKCNSCHDQLSLHGGQRFAIEECVMCHYPESDDSPVRPEDTGAPESVHFKYMIHRIHTGDHLESDYTVYGFRSSLHNYNELLYPGDLRNCQACHLPGTYGVPLPEVARATTTMRDRFTPMQPATAACLSCHDSAEAAAHAFVNVAPFGEACGACHGSGHEYDVERVHAR